ncbi:hypothetical protein LCGC14_1670340 [marine sediment metagenome]|uniref:Uncharacterized protein n=1 Tax=marine sediment metagenome TaxID=412755 RepID=A0A0F9IE37_9ZZZZ
MTSITKRQCTEYNEIQWNAIAAMVGLAANNGIERITKLTKCMNSLHISTSTLSLRIYCGMTGDLVASFEGCVPNRDNAVAYISDLQTLQPICATLNGLQMDIPFPLQ